MKWLNSNFIHNILNVLIAVNGFLLWLNCSVGTGGVASCEQSWVPPQVAIAIVAFAGVLKIIINVGRDGLAGLTKAQPPVADAMTTVVTPVKTVASGEKVTVTATTTAAKKA